MPMRTFLYILSTPCHLATGAEIRPWERGGGTWGGGTANLGGGMCPQAPLDDVTVALGIYLAKILGSRLLTLK